MMMINMVVNNNSNNNDNNNSDIIIVIIIIVIIIIFIFIFIIIIIIIKVSNLLIHPHVSVSARNVPLTWYFLTLNSNSRKCVLVHPYTHSCLKWP